MQPLTERVLRVVAAPICFAGYFLHMRKQYWRFQYFHGVGVRVRPRPGS